MKYISDIISINEIPKWKGKKTLITGQTGSGKSQFIKTQVLQFASQNRLRVLLLSNRTALRNQNETEMGEEENIVMVNYQRIEAGIINDDEDLEHYISKFDIVICDEIHYLFSDSGFNRRTDLLLGLITNDFADKTMIFITATPEIIKAFHPNFDYEYSVKKDYSYVKDVYFYNKREAPEAIIQNITDNEKVIFFSSDAKQAYELKESFNDAEFVCSDSNDMHRYSSNHTMQEIVENSYFSCRILCTTKVLDNGVNILDASVKHIVVDMMDVISLIQCIGRRRVLSEQDRVTLYIRNYHSGNINYAMMFIKNQLEKASLLEEIGAEEFQKLHRKKDFQAIVDNDFKINKAKFIYYTYIYDFLNTIKKDKDGYKTYVMKYLGLKPEQAKDGDVAFERISIKKFLEKMKNVKMFKEEQEKFKTRFFSLIFSPKNTNYRSRGLRSINAILQEDNLNYLMTSGKENSTEHRNERWWAVIETDQLEDSIQ